MLAVDDDLVALGFQERVEDLDAVAELHFAVCDHVQIHSRDEVDDARIVVDRGEDGLQAAFLYVQVVQVERQLIVHREYGEVDDRALVGQQLRQQRSGGGNAGNVEDHVVAAAVCDLHRAFF